VDMAGNDAILNRILFLPHHTVFGIYHLQVKGLAFIRQAKGLSIQLVGLEPKVFAGLVNALAGLKIDQFRWTGGKVLFHATHDGIYGFLGMNHREY
ncbi:MULTISPECIES: hypothetical protein, partial [unclassified Bacteroides]|uniref:hypothetical protein n=1 Tax=Bacteroides sp. ZJ-21 TaxID=2709391 RepID=UPI0013EBB841